MNEPVGLLNRGATCYFNSVLQGLWSCPSFNNARHDTNFDSFISKYPKYTLGEPHDAYDCLMDFIDPLDILYGETTVRIVFPGGEEKSNEKLGTLMIFPDGVKTLEDLVSDVQICDGFREFKVAMIERSHTKLPNVTTFKNVPKIFFDPPSEFRNKKLRAIIYHIGSHHGGHYFSKVLRGSEWFLIDDTNIVSLGDRTINVPPDILFYE